MKKSFKRKVCTLLLYIFSCNILIIPVINPTPIAIPIPIAEEIGAAIQVLTQVLASSQEDLLEQGQQVVSTLRNSRSAVPAATTRGII